MDDNQPIMTEMSEGTKFWCLDGNYHRTDGPAIEYADGDMFWLVRDRFHRTDGPAIEWANGGKNWYLNGEELTFDEWLDQNPDMTDEEKVMFKLKYG
jgi:hypothetical protein